MVGVFVWLDARHVSEPHDRLLGMTCNIAVSAFKFFTESRKFGESADHCKVRRFSILIYERRTKQRPHAVGGAAKTCRFFPAYYKYRRWRKFLSKTPVPPAIELPSPSRAPLARGWTQVTTPRLQPDYDSEDRILSCVDSYSSLASHVEVPLLYSRSKCD